MNKRKDILSMNELKIREISIEGWELFSHRLNSDSYYSSDRTKVLKLFTEASASIARSEFELSQAVTETGIPTPKAHEMVSIEGRRGIVYDNIIDKVSIMRSIREHPETIEESSRRFARIAKVMHGTEVDTDRFEELPERYYKALYKSGLFNKEQMARIREVVVNAKGRNTALICDFNPSNFLMSRDRDYVIDLGNFGYGHPYYDLGILYAYLHLLPIRGIARELKTTPDALMTMWRYFMIEYFETEDEAVLAEKEREISDYSLLAAYGFLSTESLGRFKMFISRLIFRRMYKKTLGSR